jgi:hypothetical protein
VIVYAVVDDTLSPTSPLGDAIETFIRREDAERFVEEVCAATSLSSRATCRSRSANSLAERGRFENRRRREACLTA